MGVLEKHLWELAMHWTVSLSGEIHSDWREQLIEGCKAHDLPVEFTSEVTDHDAGI